MITIDPPGSPHSPHPAPPTPALTRFLARARAAIGLPGTVSVLLTTDAELKRLNRTFRGKNKPTDVLSFPASPIPGLPQAHQHAGDLAISLDTAARQAAEHGHPLRAELRILLLHGLLHLSGLDHETDTDTGEMAARESELRARFRLPNSLIARSEALGRASSRHGSPTPQNSPSSRPSRPMSSRPSRPTSSRPRSSAARPSPKLPTNPRKRGPQ